MFDNLSLLGLAPVFNIQLLLDGLFIGAIFALAAYGLALVWGVMNVKNLAQGDFVIMGGYLALELGRFGIHPIGALPIVAVVMFGFGWLVYILVIRRVIDRDLFTSLLATFGIALVIQQALNLAYGPEVRVAESGFDTRYILDGQVTVVEIKLISFLLAALLAAAIVVFMKRSRIGQAILETVKTGLAVPEPERPSLAPKVELPQGLGPLVDLLKVLLKMNCERHKVAQKLVATVADLERIAAEDDAPVPALAGWRREVFGEDALALKNGRIALSGSGGQIKVVPITA